MMVMEQELEKPERKKKKRREDREQKCAGASQAELGH